jgi:hypothetical protein
MEGEAAQIVLDADVRLDKNLSVFLQGPNSRSG